MFRLTLGRASLKEPKSVAELVAWYGTNFKRAMARVHAMSPEQLCTPVDFWVLIFWARSISGCFLLASVNNHSIHHRGQLAVYPRPMGSKVPSIYGGSADEPWQG